MITIRYRTKVRDRWSGTEEEVTAEITVTADEARGIVSQITRQLAQIKGGA